LYFWIANWKAKVLHLVTNFVDLAAGMYQLYYLRMVLLRPETRWSDIK
jgi:hypothetical protein